MEFNNMSKGKQIIIDSLLCHYDGFVDNGFPEIECEKQLCWSFHYIIKCLREIKDKEELCMAWNDIDDALIAFRTQYDHVSSPCFCLKSAILIDALYKWLTSAVLKLVVTVPLAKKVVQFEQPNDCSQPNDYSQPNARVCEDA